MYTRIAPVIIVLSTNITIIQVATFSYVYPQCARVFPGYPQRPQHAVGTEAGCCGGGGWKEGCASAAAHAATGTYVATATATDATAATAAHDDATAATTAAATTAAA